MAEKKKLFLDYGELICDYRFNQDTLFRAHRLALDYINSQNRHQISLDRLSQAHNQAIQAYLQARGHDNSEWTMDQIMSLVLSNAGLNGNIPIQKISEIYKLNDHDSAPCPEVPEILRDLATRRKLGIISNLPHDSLVHELRQYDLFDLFETITMSYEVGHRKPHPSIYLEALRRANTTPEQSIFVSHDEEEVRGAERLGMESLLVKSLREVVGVL